MLFSRAERNGDDRESENAARGTDAVVRLDPVSRTIAEELFKEIRARLTFLIDVGLHYLTLDRAAPTLSGGEAQRIRLASQVGAGLVGVLYILDEPSIGLHPRDNDRLLATLRRLARLGNTVVVVEHDEDTMRAADHLVDFGPGPGVKGGEVIVQGTIDDVARSRQSLTGAYLAGKRMIPIPSARKVPDGRFLTIKGARHNNLKDIDTSFPLGLFICVTGVSGSGKSSLVGDILREALARELNGAVTEPGAHRGIEGLEHLDKVIDIDQSPIGRTPRSNPATYIKLFDQIRDLFTKLPEAKARGYAPGRFSFNVSGGRCEACEGNGSNRLEMDFLADVWVTCPVCQGKRFGRETLHVRYKGKSISDVLDMDVQEALEHFANIPKIAAMLQTLHDVGLDYIKLGQPSPTLSGGEAQRIKLARELVKKGTGKTLYILDEPTTGLHFDDVRKLLDVLHGFTEQGNTVVVIEHNLDVVKTADWIIDLGPEGGAGGGWIVAQGSPEQVAESRREPHRSGAQESPGRIRAGTGRQKKATKAGEFCSQERPRVLGGWAGGDRGPRRPSAQPQRDRPGHSPQPDERFAAGRAAREKARWRSTRSTRRAKGAMSRASRAMPASFWLPCKSRASSESRGCRRRSASSRKRPARARGQRSARSPRFTTISESFSPGWGILTAPSAACRSAPRPPTRSSRRFCTCPRARRST